VDDDIHVLELIQRHLHDLNYHTYRAVSVKEALAIMQYNAIDLLITDLQMPSVDGLQLVKYVSEHYPDIPKLMVTGYPSVEGALEAMKSGVMEYLIKPFTKAELKSAVTKSLQSKTIGKHSKESKDSVVYSEMIGNSPAIKKVTEIIDRVKNNSATVFIS